MPSPVLLTLSLLALALVGCSGEPPCDARAAAKAAEVYAACVQRYQGWGSRGGSWCGITAYDAYCGGRPVAFSPTTPGDR